MMQKVKNNKCIWIIALYLLFIPFGYGQKKFTTNSYIEKHKELAQRLMRETGVPASVILAVAMHESGYGNSRIAKYLNNHFGIKGKNNSKAIRSAYKGYESPYASYLDFVGLLQRRKSTRYMFEKYSSSDYKSWIVGIANSGYCVTQDWKPKVLATIEKYDLDDYDKL